MVVVGPRIPDPIIREHQARLVDEIRREALDGVLLFDAANLLAFCGTPHAAWDRLTCAILLRDGTALLLCPRFERPAVAPAEAHTRVIPCEETDDPWRLLADALQSAGLRRGRLGLDGRTWVEARAGLAAACPALDLVDGSAPLREVRLCKSPAEAALLRTAQARGETLFLLARDRIRPGISELDLHRDLAQCLEAQGLRVNPMIQSGPTAAVPHNPTGARRMADGDLVVIDSVVTVDGYMNDLTRTFALGSPPPRAVAAYRAVRQAHAAAIAAAAPGIECRRLDQIAREIITAAGFGEFFSHRLGHGLGIECHEPPYLNGANPERLRPGMCVTIEPGVYVPGEFGVRIEDDVLITESGCEVLRHALPTDLSAAFS